MPNATADGLSAVALDRWPELVGLAALLTGSGVLAEEVYATALRRRVELHDPDAAVAYLRRMVVERSRRSRGANAPLDLDVLPRRQREALVLRLHDDATDSQVAAAMRCSATDVEPLVAKALTSLDVAPAVLAQRMAAYVEGLDVERPDVAAVAAEARRSRRRDTALASTATVVVVALLVAGVVAGVQPRGHGAVADGAAGPLPGLAPTMSIHVPTGFEIDEVDAADGQIWALADSGDGIQHFVLLHGPAGGALVPLPGAEISFSGEYPGLAVNGDRAVVLASAPGSSDGGPTAMTTYDAASGAVVSSTALPAGESAGFAPVVGGGTAREALVLTRPTADGSTLLTVSLLAGGRLAAQRGPLTVPGDASPFGVSPSELTAVQVSVGAPSRAYFSGSPGSLASVDLDSGAIARIHLSDDTSTAGSSSEVQGEVDGTLLYESSDGLFAGRPGSPTTRRVGDGDNQQEVLVVAGRAFTSVAPNDDTWQQLDPTTYAPVGPIVTTRVGQGPVAGLRAGSAEFTVGAGRDGLGGMLEIYPT